MKKIFIVNPKSGCGKGLIAAKEIEKLCKERQYDYEMIYTQKKGDATNIANFYKDQKVIIYSVGGDGTINEIVNGMAKGEAYLNVIPSGSGNDFYKTVKDYPKGIFDIDLGKVNDTYFVNSASIGLDAEIGINANLMKKYNIPKSQIYNASLVYTLLKYKAYDLNINNQNEMVTLISITNGKYYGGGFKISPDAELNNGYLNLVSACELGKMALLPVLVKLLKSQHYNDKSVNHEKIKDLHISSDKDIICGIDGELLIDRDFVFKVEENAIHYYNEEDMNIKCLIMSK